MIRGIFTTAVLALLFCMPCSAQRMQSEEARLEPNETNTRFYLSQGTKALTVTYSIPQACMPVHFLDQNSAIHKWVRSKWKPQNSCFDLSKDGLVKRTGDSASCITATFAIPEDDVSIDRMYLAYGSMADKSALLYLGYYMISSKCSDGITIDSGSSGRSFIGNKKIGSKTVRDGDLEPFVRAYAFLSPSKQSIDENILVDEHIPNWLRKEIGDSVKLFTAVLTGVDESFKEKTPNIYVLKSKPGDSQRTWMKGDVTFPPAIRLSFGVEGEQKSDELVKQVRRFLAHELSHLAQPDQRFSRTSATLSEGGAEFMALHILYRNQLIDINELTLEVNRALLSCAVRIGNESWLTSSVKETGLTPYQCGLALHVLSRLYSLNLSQLQSDPLRTLVDAYKNSSLEDARPFLIMLACKEISKPCDEKPIKDVLESDEFGSALMSSIGKLEGAKKLLLSDLERGVFSDLFGSLPVTVFGSLMQTDCGTQSFWTTKSDFKVAQNGCKELADGDLVESISAQSIGGSPIELLKSFEAECSKSGVSRVLIKERGEVKLRCPEHLYRLPDNFYILNSYQVKKVFIHH
jgi:hypothetical protein